MLEYKADKSLQKKQKRRKYQSVDHFMKDIDTMFNNAKIYNEDESRIYKDANQLQVCPCPLIICLAIHSTDVRHRLRLTD